MGQIKNIKLHIVTDIKKTRSNEIAFSTIKQTFIAVENRYLTSMWSNNP